MNVEDLIRIRIADAARKVEAARERRADMQAARQHGLAYRHAAKLRHLARTDPQGEGQSPTVARSQEDPTNPPSTVASVDLTEANDAA